MPTTEGKFPGLARFISGSGTSWIGPDGIKADDSAYASTAFSSSADSNMLFGYSFGFTNDDIPAHATITGIKARANLLSVSTGTALVRAYASKLVNAAPTTYAGPLRNVSIPTSAYSLIDLVTGEVQLFGQTWSVDEILASGFGVGLVVTDDGDFPAGTRCDYIQVAINYSVPASGGGFFALAG